MKKEIEVKIEITPEEFRNLAGKQKDFSSERTFGYFKEDFSNIEDGIFPRIKYIEGKKKEIVLTVKIKKQENSNFFQREELEVKLRDKENLDDLRNIVKSLGFNKEIVFEKKRKNVLENKSITVSLDKLPFGFFVEFEGKPEKID